MRRLSVILDQGYSGVSIEAIARTAGVTRPVIYDHFPNLGRLLRALVEREERIAVAQLEHVVPRRPRRLEPVRSCLPAACGASSTRWPPGRRRGESSCCRSTGPRRWCASTSRRTARGSSSASSASCAGRSSSPSSRPTLDVELTFTRDPRSRRAGRADGPHRSERYPPERYERFVGTVMSCSLRGRAMTAPIRALRARSLRGSIRARRALGTRGGRGAHRAPSPLGAADQRARRRPLCRRPARKRTRPTR